MDPKLAGFFLGGASCALGVFAGAILACALMVAFGGTAASSLIFWAAIAFGALGGLAGRKHGHAGDAEGNDDGFHVGILDDLILDGPDIMK